MAHDRQLSFLLARLLLVLTCTSAVAQAPAVAEEPKPHKLGVFFWHDSPNDEAAFVGIKKGLEAAGIAHELVERRADSDTARSTRVLGELREAGCELVFAMGTQAALLATQHLGELPVVYAAVSNPIASGVVADWQGSARPLAGGTNRIPPATICKVFRQAVPGLHKLGMLRSKPSGVVSRAELSTMREYLQTEDAPALEILEELAADDADLVRATRALVDAKVQAIWVPIDFTIYRNLSKIRTVTDAAQIPMIATAHNGARDGAIVTVTVDFELHGRRVAALAARILAGEDPGTMPVDTMHSYAILANLTAAARIGHELPLSLLVQADTLIRSEEPPREGR